VNSANFMIPLFMEVELLGGLISPNKNSIFTSSIFESTRKSGFLPWLFPSSIRLSFELSDSPFALCSDNKKYEHRLIYCIVYCNNFTWNLPDQWKIIFTKNFFENSMTISVNEGIFVQFFILIETHWRQICKTEKQHTYSKYQQRTKMFSIIRTYKFFVTSCAQSKMDLSSSVDNVLHLTQFSCHFMSNNCLSFKN